MRNALNVYSWGGVGFSFFGMHNKMAIQPVDSILPYTPELLQYRTQVTFHQNDLIQRFRWLLYLSITREHSYQNNQLNNWF